MRDIDKLRAWAEEERKKGLVDIRFFRGASDKSSVEESARNVYAALTNNDAIDITDEPL